MPAGPDATLAEAKEVLSEVQGLLIEPFRDAVGAGAPHRERQRRQTSWLCGSGERRTGAGRCQPRR